MAATSQLLDRIDAEFREVEGKIKKYQTEKQEEFEGRQQRLEQFSQLCESLSEVWRPKLESFAERFRDRVQVAPTVSKNRRSATMTVQSPLAKIELTFTVMTDEDIRHLVLDYQLSILPILMRFEKSQQLELPLDRVDPQVVGAWIDDRLIDAVRTILSLHQNEYYLKGHLVRDPIANIAFPKYAAAATLDWNGKTQYFISDTTRDEFAKANQIGL
jgi:YHS domain-containing protein